MKSLPYLDIHTHRRNPDDSSVSVVTLSPDDILSNDFSFTYATAGIHPWWLEDFSEQEINHLKSKVEGLVQSHRIWGIGEAGIDRAYPELLQLQKELFSWHLDLSERFHLPLVIHSVRSGSDFLQILKEKRPLSPWIFHDFRGNETLMRDLLRLHPNCYFSFGLSIDNSPSVRELLPIVPIERLFLETDDQKHLDIHDIFLRASHFIGTDPEFLKSQLWLNFKRISDKKFSVT